MAGPNDPPTPVLIDPEASQASADALNNAYIPAAAGAGATTDSLTNSATNLVQNGLQKIAAAGPLAAAALVGVSQASQNFAAGLDSARVTTFSEQLKAIGTAAVRPGAAIGELQKAGAGLLTMLEKVGGGSREQSGFISRMWDVIRAGGKDVGVAVKMISDYAQNVVALGDEMTVVRQATLAQATASGALDAVLHKAGNNMKDFNAIAAQQQQMWVATGKALGILPADVAKYAGELNKIPGVLDQMVGGHAKAAAETKIFQDSLRLMKITGRDYESINKEMRDAVMQFGTSQKGALDYTTRMSVAAKELKIPVDELQKAINGSSSAFKAFVTGEESGNEMTKNLQASMAGYIQMLRNAHVPMSVATDMAGQFATRIGEMTIAQKAFISGQTGGPGGLMGAFQLDKLMDEGKIDQVFTKVQDVLRKQFGRVVTTAQAAQSQSAAEQMTRQIMILRQGPLGQFAKSDAEARRLLDAMASGSGGAEMKKMTSELKQEKPLQSFLDSGNKIAQGSQGVLNEILQALAGAEYTTARGVSEATQPGLGARTFFRPEVGGRGGITPEVQEERRRFGREGAAGEGGRTLLESTMRDLKGLPVALAGTMRALSNAMKAGDDKTVAALDTRLKAQVEEYRKSAATAPSAQRATIMSNVGALTGAETRASQQYYSGLPPGVGTVGMGGARTVTPSPLTPQQQERKIDDYIRTHPGVSRAAARAKLSEVTRDSTARGPTIPSTTDSDFAPAGARLPPPVARKQPGATATGTVVGAHGGVTPVGVGGPVQVTLAPGTRFSMDVNSTCTNCGSRFKTTEIAHVQPTAVLPRS